MEETMKKAIVIIIVILVACMSLSAADISIGIMQNYFDTSAIIDVEFDHFGVEGSVGIPLVWGTIGIIDSISNGEEFSFGDALGMLLMPGAMVNGYWKVIDGNVFGLRLGLQADVIGAITEDFKSIVGLWGMSVGLNFKFNDRFSANLTGTLPAILPLNLISEDATKFGLFYYAWGEPAEDSGAGFIALAQVYYGFYSELARLSFKWSI